MNLLIITNNPRNASFRQRIELHLPALRDSGLDCEVARLPRGTLARRRLFKRAAEYEDACNWSGAIGNYRTILGIDPYNRKATRRLLRAQRYAVHGGPSRFVMLTVRVKSWWDRLNRRVSDRQEELEKESRQYTDPG